MKNLSQKLVLGAVSTLLFSSFVFASDLDLAQTPLAVETEGVSPNIMMVVDESGSMDENDVFYSPGYDANKVYRCTAIANVLNPIAGNVVRVLVGRNSPYSGVPFFTYGSGLNTNYYVWGNNPHRNIGGITITNPAVCFNPEEKYLVRLRADDSFCTYFSNNSENCSTSNNTSRPYNNNFYAASNSDATEELDGNFLNWYFSATESKFANSTLTGGLRNDYEPHGYWTENYATNFNTSSTNRGLKSGVSYAHDRNDVARDVARKVVRDIDNAKLGVVSYSSNSNSIKLRHGIVPLESIFGVETYNANKLTLLEAINDIGKSGGTPTGKTLLSVANYFFTGWPASTTKFDFKTTNSSGVVTGTTERSLEDVFGSGNKLYTTGATAYSANTKIITADLWCQKNAVAVLTDGKATTAVERDGITTRISSYVPKGVNATTFAGLSNSDGGNSIGSDCPLCEKNMIRIAGALYDHDFLKGVNGVQNIETFMIAFGDKNILDRQQFKMAGTAGGGGTNNFYPARDGAALAQAFKDIISRVQAASASVTAIAVSAVSELRADNYAIQATYDTEFWTSSLRALRLNQKGQFINPNDSLEDENAGRDSSVGITPLWDSNNILNEAYLFGEPSSTPKVRSRQVFTWNGTEGIRFGSDTMTRPSSATANFPEFNALPARMQADLSMRASTNSQERYDLMMYLLGDVKHEVGLVGAGGEEKYRRRGVYQLNGSNKIEAVNKGGFLGDIAHSSPMYVKEPSRPWDDVNFGAEDKRYSQFFAQHKDRAPMVYVGTNRGFLHAITVEQRTRNVNGTNRTYAAGSEVFAYMPSMLASTVPEEGFNYLASKSYDHRAYVDLTPTISDVFMDFYSAGTALEPTSAEWRTVLVGGLRAGGKGLFALDITCPFRTNNGSTCDDEQFDANNVLWEFSSQDDADLGFTYGEPVIARVYYDNGVDTEARRHGPYAGRWAAIVSNGYNSLNGRAVLFILFLDGGRDGTWTHGVDYVKLYAGSSSEDNYASKNGLSSATAMDIDGDGIIDRIYAGDVKGQMWSFDVSQSVVYQASQGGQP